MPAPTHKDEWIAEFVRYVDEHTDRGSGKYVKLLADQTWRDSAANMSGEQAAMRWVVDHAPHRAKARHVPRKTS